MSNPVIDDIVRAWRANERDAGLRRTPSTAHIDELLDERAYAASMRVLVSAPPRTIDA